MWKLEFRRETLIWILAAAFIIGLGVRGFEMLRARRLEYPQVISARQTDATPLQWRADSMMRARIAAEQRPLNINSATAADFETLDGIGKVLAARIVAYRTEHGSFASVDELDEVSGIGPKRSAAMRARCTVDSTPR